MIKKSKDIIYLIPHTHYDAIWIFTKEDYFYINIDLILKKVINLLERDKNYKFLIEQTYLLEEVERRYPEFFKKIKKYVKEKKIELVDGEYLMADTMLPQGETLIREILVGKSYIKKKFGINVEVMWQADSFGLNAQLPQIYKKSGYKYVAFRRGCPEKKPSEFFWEGLDSTRILTHWMPLGYRAGLDLRKLEENYLKLKKLAATNHILMPSGSGVTIPREETSEVVKEWNKKHKKSEIKIATPIEFFKNLEKYKKLKIRKGEMYSCKYSEVFPDCCSTRIWIKQNLRKYECATLTFERINTITSLINGYDFEGLDDCWKKILFLAFHDVVPGTGMDIVYGEAKQNIDYLHTKLNYLISKTLKSIIEREVGVGKGDIIVFNPLSFDVSNWVEVYLNFEKGKIYKINGLESGDELIDIEIINFSRYEDESLRSVRLGFVANIPALGYKIYKLTDKQIKQKNFLRIIGNTIENKFFKLKFSPNSGLIEVFKNNKKICKGNELIIEEEIGDLYTHKETTKIPIKTESGEGIKYGAFKIKNFWIDKSILRRVINIETDYYSLRWPYRLTDKLKPIIWRHKFIKFKKKIIVYRDLPRIDFITIVENNHPRIRLRVKFSTDIKNSKYICDTQFGVVERQTDLFYLDVNNWAQKPSGVAPSLKWIDYSNRTKGLTIINKGIPENEIRDSNIYLTLLRSVSMLSSDGKYGSVIPVQDARELKKYIFEYALYPHEGNWKEAKSYKQGYEFNFNLIALQIPNNKYKLNKSFLKIEPDNIILTAFKKSENGKDIILRFYETCGKETEAKITFFRKMKNVRIVNLLEEEIEEDKKIVLENNKIKVVIKPFEIITLKLKL
ncbi:MAG TPA: glycoside hydrolase [Candidatus Aenigmarchaeota archaeon]|nr:glycoside hydrolase [Candidatus Aenigmarchaeota archaeon]